LLACPGASWRSKGYPPRAELDRLAALFNEVKRGLADTGVTLGWWNTLTLKSGIGEGFERIRADGSWKVADVSLKGDVLTVGIKVEPCEPICLLFGEESGGI